MGKRTKDGAEPVRERQCIVTRQRADDHDLIRFVADPSGIVVPDVKAVLPGRGAWVLANHETLDLAIKRKAFARALKAEGPLGGFDDLSARTEQVLRQQAMGALGFARKAGLVQTGFAKVESALKAGSVHALLHATGAGADGQQKLDRLAGHTQVPVLRVLTHEEMGVSLGLEHVIHAALLNGPGSNRFLAPLQRLEAFGARPVAQPVTDTASASDASAAKRSIAGADKDPGLGDKTAV